MAAKLEEPAADWIAFAAAGRDPDTGPSKTTNKFSPEVRARAVGMILDREGDYDNALAETINGLYPAEVSHRRGPSARTMAFHGVPSRPSSSPHWSGPIGSTIGVCWSQSATSRPPQQNNNTMPCWTTSPWLRNFNQMASDNPGPFNSQNASYQANQHPLPGRR